MGAARIGTRHSGWLCDARLVRRRLSTPRLRLSSAHCRPSVRTSNQMVRARIDIISIKERKNLEKNKDKKDRKAK
jgi:hypothetical protein